MRHPRRWWAKPELNRETGRNGKACSRGRLVRIRDRTIFTHAVLEFGGCRWVGRQPPCVREDRKMESKGGVYLALDFIIRYPSKGVFDI